MLKHSLFAAAATAASILATSQAQASVIPGLTVIGSTSISGQADVDGTGGMLAGFGGPGTTISTEASAPVDLGSLIFVGLSDDGVGNLKLSAPDISSVVVGSAEEYLSLYTPTAVAASFVAGGLDTLEVLFSALTGNAADLFGGANGLTRLTLVGEFGDTVFDFFAGSPSGYVTTDFKIEQVQVSAVPLPTAGLLLAAGLGSLFVARRRKSA